MAEHVLITSAIRRLYRTAPIMPDRAEYDRARGYWLKDDKPLVTTTEFTENRRTKKEDQETMEDQKGV